MSPSRPRGTARATAATRGSGTAAGWGKRADRIRDWGLPVSVTMVDALALQPGDRVLELAAGPGDTGFMAAELIAPGGTLICSDGAEAMLAIARERAAAAGLRNVEFRQLELEWIDLDAASVDGVLCRWGIMLVVDPAAAALEIRRILRPGATGRLRGLGRGRAEPLGDDRRARDDRARPRRAAGPRRAGHVRAGRPRRPAGAAVRQPASPTSPCARWRSSAGTRAPRITWPRPRRCRCRSGPPWAAWTMLIGPRWCSESRPSSRITSTPMTSSCCPGSSLVAVATA